MEETAPAPVRNSSSVFSDLFAGVISGLMTIIAAISYATLVFSGGGAEFLPLGITSALTCSMTVGLIAAFRSSSPVTIAGPDANISAILALIITSVTTKAFQTGKGQGLFTLLWLTIVLSTFLTGAFLYLVGRFRMGRWIRFIPYPVIGGFLAGTGWLLARGSFKVMCGIPLSLDSMGTLLEKGAILHWLPGGIFALAAGLPHVGSLMLVSAIVILLNAASVELATRKDVELDRELTSTGLANILSAPFGALAGCMALSRTILNYKAGATGRISGITCALICGVVLLAAARPWPSSPGRYWGDFCFIWACLFWRSGFGMDGSAYPGWIMGWSSA